MRIVKLYYWLAFFPLTFLDDEKKSIYKNKVYDLISEIAIKDKYQSYSKHFLHGQYRTIDNALVNFCKQYNKTFSDQERKFMRGLINMTKSIKRFVVNTNSHVLRGVFYDLNPEGLKKFTDNYSDEHHLKQKLEITFLEEPFYIKVAESVAEKAEKMLQEEYKGYDVKEQRRKGANIV